MRLSQIFVLGRTQHELDFVDVDPNLDTRLFLHPHHLRARTDQWSHDAIRTIDDFWGSFLRLIRDHDSDQARALLSHLREPNETALGMSRGTPRGRGVGPKQAKAIFDSIIQSPAVQTGLVEDLEDLHVLGDNIAADKISDITTNIIRHSLILYTQQQCELWQIPLTPNVPTGYYWDRRAHHRRQGYEPQLVIDGRVHLLVPKIAVSYARDYTAGRYHQRVPNRIAQSLSPPLPPRMLRPRLSGPPGLRRDRWVRTA